MLPGLSALADGGCRRRSRFPVTRTRRRDRRPAAHRVRGGRTRRIAAARGDSDRAGLIWGAVEAEATSGRVGQWERDRPEFEELVLAVDGPRSRKPGARAACCRSPRLPASSPPRPSRCRAAPVPPTPWAGRLEVVEAPAGHRALVRDGVDERLQLLGVHPVRDTAGGVDRDIGADGVPQQPQRARHVAVGGVVALEAAAGVGHRDPGIDERGHLLPGEARPPGRMALEAA